MKVHNCRSFFLSLLAFCLSSCTSLHTKEKLPFYNSPDFTPEWIEESSDAYEQIHTIAPFKFINQLGDTISNADFDGHIYIADFFFTTCPSICPKMTSNMEKLQAHYKEDKGVLLLSHTVMPWIDSVDVLAAYGKLHGVSPEKWHLVTGDQEQIYHIARQSYFAEEMAGIQKRKDEFLHTEHFLLIDPKRRIRGVYNGTLPVEMKRLKADVALLKNEVH